MSLLQIRPFEARLLLQQTFGGLINARPRSCPILNLLSENRSDSLILESSKRQLRTRRVCPMIDFTGIGQPSQLLLKHLFDRPLAWAPER